MLSRVQELRQVYILNKFNPKKLYPSQKAIRELDRMNRVSINNNPDPWSKGLDNAIKIVSLNCAGLKAHIQDIRTDDRLQKADIMHFIEISLHEDEDEDTFTIDGYEHQFIKNGNGKGIATYYANDKFQHSEDIKTDKFQITKFKHETMDILNVYRS